MRQATTWVLTILGCAAVSACGGGDASGGAAVVRDTLPNGAERLSYAALPAPAGEPAAIELSIGAMEGEAHEIFGDVRSIEADAQGNIYVFDTQATEVRVFDPEGQYLRTLTRKGGGPGEVMEANGMVLDRTGTLWLHDHGQWQMVGIDLDGNEVARHPIHVLSYGYVYDGAVDDSGRFWKFTSHSDDDDVFPPPNGLNEGTSRSYVKWLDPASGATDSLFLGERGYRSVVRQYGNGYSVRGIPFASGGAMAIDPAGGFWLAAGDVYRLVRLDERGDTAIVIEADVAPLAVTDADRDAYIASAVERRPEDRASAEEALSFAADVHPVLDQLILDDARRVWVRRIVAQGENPLYDVFAHDGEYLGGVRLTFTPATYIPPRIRNGKFYALVRDSLDVPTVVRSTVPPLGVQPVVGETR
jgi:hypothetical protein